LDCNFRGFPFIPVKRSVTVDVLHTVLAVPTAVIVHGHLERCGRENSGTATCYQSICCIGKDAGPSSD
jgi:hypothetical protein